MVCGFVAWTAEYPDSTALARSRSSSAVCSDAVSESNVEESGAASGGISCSPITRSGN